MEKTTNRRDIARVEPYKAFFLAMVIASSSFAGTFLYLAISEMTRPLIATSHYHFNIQFEGLDETSMNEIVNNSVIPLLQMYSRHPAWKANIEFQGLMLEWMNRLGNTTRKTNVTLPNNAGTLENQNGIDLLRYLVARGQIQLIVVQYSDALAIAYPYIDFFKSINYTRQLLRDLDIINATSTSGVSHVVLLQEGQFALGSSRLVADFQKPTGSPAYDTFLTTRETLSFYGVENRAGLYTYEIGGEQVYVLPYHPVPMLEGGAEHHLLWFFDGEYVNDGRGPTWTESGYIDYGDEAAYIGFNEEKQTNHERQLEDLEQMGDVFMTLDEWVAYMISHGDVQPLGKWVPETHWAIYRHHSSFVWMSDTRGNTPYDDNEILARCYETHQMLLATEVMLNYSRSLAAIDATTYRSLFSNMTRAWLNLALAEVSDSTGIKPSTFEGEDAIRNLNNAISNASYVRSFVINATPGLNDTINVMHGAIQILPSNLGTPNPLVVNGSAVNFTTTGVASIGDLGQVGIQTMNNDSFGITRMRVETAWDPTLNGTEYYSVLSNFPRTNTSAFTEKWSYITFTGDFSTIQYSPCFWENLSVQITRADYNADTPDSYNDWSADRYDNFEIYMPLPNGLIYSTNMHCAIVKNCTSTHLCAKWNTRDVRFMQTKTLSNLNPAGETWNFFVMLDVNISQAIAFANLVNTNAPLRVHEGI